MQLDIALSFDALTPSRAAAAAELCARLASLVEGALESCDAGADARTRRLRIRARVSPGGASAAVLARVAFWAARAGGRAEIAGQDFDVELAACRVLVEVVPAARVVELICGAFSSDAGATPPPSDRVNDVLALHVGGPGWDGITYEPEVRVLHVPSPLAPPVGDTFLLELDAPGYRPFAYRGLTRVVASRAATAAGPGAPAEFALAVPSDAHAAHTLLVASCPRPGASEDARTAPRYRVTGPVRVGKLARTGEETIAYDSTEDLERDYVSNLSHGGAFIRTARAYAPGSQLDLRLRLPNGQELRVGATVVRVMPAGVGVQFALDPRSDATLAAAMTAIPGRARRVLVVDDDVLARRMLTDAFAARGIECVTAPDGAAGLHVLLEELLSLDAIVTDIRMPGLSGDELIEMIRTAGGERDLPIVVLGGTVSGPHRAQLIAAGADAVVLKEAGPEHAVDAVEEAIDRRVRDLLRRTRQMRAAVP